MTLIINGQPHQLPEPTTLETVLATLSFPQEGVALALNGQVLRRADWESTALGEGDRIEIVRAVGGG